MMGSRFCVPTLAAAAIALALVVTNPAFADPVPWDHPDGTVHLYEFIDNGADIS